MKNKSLLTAMRHAWVLAISIRVGVFCDVRLLAKYNTDPAFCDLVHKASTHVSAESKVESWYACTQTGAHIIHALKWHLFLYSSELANNAEPAKPVDDETTMHMLGHLDEVAAQWLEQAQEQPTESAQDTQGEQDDSNHS